MKFLFENYKRILITGGSGFIGSNLIIKLLLETSLEIFNLDKFSYASDNLAINNCIFNLGDAASKRYKFLKTDLHCRKQTNDAIEISNPDIIINLAAESHVDRSIYNPKIFIDSNINGTFNLLEASLEHFRNLNSNKKKYFRLLHVSTDEVFGSLSLKGSFSEDSKYDPRSPYSASKAASDHLVKAWFHTFGLPILISNCGNNFGPWQYPEKLIPTIIINALSNRIIPIYGDGKNIRDWIYVDDHINALLLVALNGRIGESYCIGSNQEKTNIEIAREICLILDKLKPSKESYIKQISFVDDRPGHDKRYSINSTKISKELGWISNYKFSAALKLTIDWYLKNLSWCNQKSN
tara:strand:+ start:1986 stop:3041 length:1056 start_codon:yes stop_codon:yes gene_type:complete